MSELTKTEVAARIESEQSRVLANLANRTDIPKQQFWLSFAGRKFKGVAIVHADDFIEAVMICNLLGINPGGEVAGHEIPPVLVAPPEYVNKLLTKAEAKTLDDLWMQQIEDGKVDADKVK